MFPYLVDQRLAGLIHASDIDDRALATVAEYNFVYRSDPGQIPKVGFRHVDFDMPWMSMMFERGSEKVGRREE